MLPSELVGSVFHSHVFGDPETLLDYINTHEPIEVLQQRDKRFAFCFAAIDGRPVGIAGLAKRNEIQPSQIERQVRDGLTIEVGLVELLPETHLFCVIADMTSECLSIITAFPGGHARPFAQKNQQREEYELNKKFWEEHVLLKQKNTMQ
jgi:hypothetical protein